MKTKEIENWLYDSDYLFKEAYKDIQTICGTKQYHVELLEAFQSALLKAPNSDYAKYEMYQCPYEKACHCKMDEPCKGCETWAAYFA